MADERLFELFITFSISVIFLFNSWTPDPEWNGSFDPKSFVFNSKAAFMKILQKLTWGSEMNK